MLGALGALRTRGPVDGMDRPLLARMIDEKSPSLPGSV